MAYTTPNFRNAPTAYLRANNLLQKRPIYYCVFGLVTGPGGVNSQVLPYQYSTGPILNPTVTRKRYMSAPRAFSSQINPVTFQGTLGQITFDLQNQNGEISNIVASYTMKNRYVTIYRGFDFLNESDYIPVYTGQINNWTKSQDATYYTFTVVDPLKMATQSILNGHSTLVSNFDIPTAYPDGTCVWAYIGQQSAAPWQTNTAYAVGAKVTGPSGTFQCIKAGTSTPNFGGGGPSLPTTLTVTSVYGFAPKTDMLDGNGPRSYLKIDNNLFSYTGVSAGSISDGTVAWQFTGSYGYVTLILDGSVSWRCLGPTNVTTNPWQANTAYSQFNNVTHGGYLWNCVTGGTSAASGGPTFTLSVVMLWQSNVQYTVGMLVTNNNHIYICQTAGLSAPTYGPAGVGVTGSQTFTGVQVVTVNNNGESIAQSHQAGATVDNYVLYTGNPVDIMLQILMSTGTGTNYSGTGTNYDVLPAGQGIGVPYTSINISNIELQKNTYIGNMTFLGYFTDQVQGLKFIQDNILQQAMFFMFSNVNGQVDISFPYPAGSNDAVTLDQTNVIGNPQFDAHLQTGGYFYNDIDIQYDYQPIPDFYANEVDFIDGASIATYREDSQLSIVCQMVVTYLNGLYIVNRMSSLYLKLFSNPPPVITCKTFDAMHLLNPGALVYLNHPNIPNYKTGKDGGGIPILCIVVNAGPDYFSGAMNVTLLGIGFYQFKKYARWSPTSILNGGQFPTFPNATPAQKVYGFWGNKVGVYSQQSDNSDGYYWGP